MVALIFPYKKSACFWLLVCSRFRRIFRISINLIIDFRFVFARQTIAMETKGDTSSLQIQKYAVEYISIGSFSLNRLVLMKCLHLLSLPCENHSFQIHVRNASNRSEPSVIKYIIVVVRAIQIKTRNTWRINPMNYVCKPSAIYFHLYTEWNKCRVRHACWSFGFIVY